MVDVARVISRMVVTLALIPAYSRKEKENRSAVSWNVASRRLADTYRATCSVRWLFSPRPTQQAVM